jgi:hypothetical protein
MLSQGFSAPHEKSLLLNSLPSFLETETDASRVEAHTEYLVRFSSGLTMPAGRKTVPVRYTCQGDESLAAIAEAHRTGVAEIELMTSSVAESATETRDSHFQPLKGTLLRLLVPAAAFYQGKAEKMDSERGDEKEGDAAALSTPEGELSVFTYVTQEGDTVESISASHELNPDTVIDDNPKLSSLLRHWSADRSPQRLVPRDPTGTESDRTNEFNERSPTTDETYRVSLPVGMALLLTQLPDSLQQPRANGEDGNGEEDHVKPNYSRQQDQSTSVDGPPHPNEQQREAEENAKPPNSTEGESNTRKGDAESQAMDHQPGPGPGTGPSPTPAQRRLSLDRPTAAAVLSRNRSISHDLQGSLSLSSPQMGATGEGGLEEPAVALDELADGIANRYRSQDTATLGGDWKLLLQLLGRLDSNEQLLLAQKLLDCVGLRLPEMSRPPKTPSPAPESSTTNGTTSGTPVPQGQQGRAPASATAASSGTGKQPVGPVPPTPGGAATESSAQSSTTQSEPPKPTPKPELPLSMYVFLFNERFPRDANGKWAMHLTHRHRYSEVTLVSKETEGFQFMDFGDDEPIPGNENENGGHGEEPGSGTEHRSSVNNTPKGEGTAKPSHLKLEVTCFVSPGADRIPSRFLSSVSGAATLQSVTCTTGLAVPTQIRKISHCFLMMNPTLKSVTLNDFPALREIGDGFLAGCSALESFRITGKGGASSVLSIGECFMEKCVSLKDLDLSSFTNVASIGASFLAECDGLVTLRLGKAFGWVREIGAFFLFRCQSLQSLDLHLITELRKIPDGFLTGCTSLSKVDMSGFRGVETIGENCCFGGLALKSVEIDCFPKVKAIPKGYFTGSYAVKAPRCGLAIESTIQTLTPTTPSVPPPAAPPAPSTSGPEAASGGSEELLPNQVPDG